MPKNTPYRELITKIRRIAQIIPNISKIVFEPRGDGRSFNMYWHVPSMNENVQFGVLFIPADFVKFLKSGSAPKSAWSPDNAYWYLTDGVLDIDRQTTGKEYQTIENNLKILQSGDQNAINNFINTGYPKAAFKTVVDKDYKTRNQEHNNFVFGFINWQRGQQGQSQAIPHMAKQKIGLNKLSFRDKKTNDGSDING